MCRSDPSSFSIYLVNMHGYPNVHKLVAENVKTSDGSYTMDNISGIDKGYVLLLVKCPLLIYTDNCTAKLAPASKSTSSPTMTRTAVSWPNRRNSKSNLAPLPLLLRVRPTSPANIPKPTPTKSTLLPLVLAVSYILMLPCHDLKGYLKGWKTDYFLFQLLLLPQLHLPRIPRLLPTPQKQLLRRCTLVALVRLMLRRLGLLLLGLF